MLETSILKKVIFGSIKPPTETTCDPDTFFPLCKLKSKSIQQENSSIYCPKKKKKSNKAIFTSYHETFLLGGGRGGKPISPPTRHPQRRWISGGGHAAPTSKAAQSHPQGSPRGEPPGLPPPLPVPRVPSRAWRDRGSLATAPRLLSALMCSLSPIPLSSATAHPPRGQPRLQGTPAISGTG